MSKTYISSLLVVLLAGAQTIRAQENLDNVLAQMDSSDQSGAAEATVQAASIVMDANSADLFEKGVAYYRAGKYQEAEAVFGAMLDKDPYDRKAMSYLKRTSQKISANEVRKQTATRAAAFAEVDAAWNPTIKNAGVLPGGANEQVKTADDIAIEAMSDRLTSIIIPSLDFRDANIKDVVLFLTETCRRLDASGKGVNILLLGMEGSAAAEQNNITISIRDMNLLEALQYIVEMASLKYEIKPRAVAVSPVNYVAEVDMKLESFDIIPEVGSEMESMAGGDGGGADDLFGDVSSGSDAGPADVTGFFSIVDWPEGSSAVYQPNFHKLFVKNTPKNIKALKEILGDLEDEAIKKRSQQVEIEAKFVEFSEGALEELGFDWTITGSGSVAGWRFDDRTSFGSSRTRTGADSVTPDGDRIHINAVDGYELLEAGTQNLLGGGQRSNTSAFESLQSGILSSMGGQASSLFFTRDHLDLRLSAMEQEGTADVLSAPKITTKSGNEAIIRVVEVHRYPQDYDVETGQRTAPVVKPQDWEDYDLGVVLKVTPVVDSENNTIDLDLQPEITKHKGFDTYIAGFNAYESGGNNTVEVFGNSAPLEILMPYFETRSVQTQVTIADGSTVLMGGLVDERTESFRDQVPFLGDLPYVGRLFRTEGSRTSKQNLVIYVTATQVDDRGMTRADRELARQAAN